VILVGLAIDQIAQSGLSSLSVIYYSAQLFSSILAGFPPFRPSLGQISLFCGQMMSVIPAAWGIIRLSGPKKRVFINGR
ncbi:hypothetical protein, partial [Serratia nevei]|uniref:hypothetical protein n=1 Tax=Serratia nevei TaxID=2703794 RepID=UPI00254A76D4